MQNQCGQWTWRDEVGDKDKERGKAVLVDIDGVLSDASHRQDYLRGDKKDWDGFFSACVEDPPIPYMVELLNWLDPKILVITLTARPHKIHDQTVNWLNENAVRWDLLVMRNKSESHLSAKEFKAQAIQDLVKAGFDFLVGFEDDPANIEAIQQAGVGCVYIHSGYYDPH